MKENQVRRFRVLGQSTLLTIGLIVMAELAWAGCPATGCWDLALFGDAACTTCNLDIPVGHSGDVYIVAQSYEPNGILGAELRVVGLPVGWTHVSTASPLATAALGDPFGNGSNIAFTQPQVGECALLYRVTVVATSAVENVTLSLVQHASPSNPNFACPKIICNCSPVFPLVCVPGRGMSINGVDCTVGIQDRTWSAVKSVYVE
jgi:hypothetical protein